MWNKFWWKLIKKLEEKYDFYKKNWNEIKIDR